MRGKSARCRPVWPALLFVLFLVCGCAAARTAAPAEDAPSQTQGTGRPTTAWELMYGTRPSETVDDFDQTRDAAGHFQTGIYLALSDIDLPRGIESGLKSVDGGYRYEGAAAPCTIHIRLFPNEPLIERIEVERRLSETRALFALPEGDADKAAFSLENAEIVAFIHNVYVAVRNRNSTLPAASAGSDARPAGQLTEAEQALQAGYKRAHEARLKSPEVASSRYRNYEFQTVYESDVMRTCFIFH